MESTLKFDLIGKILFVFILMTEYWFKNLKVDSSRQYFFVIIMWILKNSIEYLKYIL